MNFLDEIIEVGGSVLGNIQDNLQAAGTNALATAEYNKAVANYVNSKALQRERDSKRLFTILTVAVVGILLVVALPKIAGLFKG